ncbi:hypothetical protein D3C80_1840190 [compost metagenome]
MRNRHFPGLESYRKGGGAQRRVLKVLHFFWASEIEHVIQVLPIGYASLETAVRQLVPEKAGVARDYRAAFVIAP